MPARRPACGAEATAGTRGGGRGGGGGVAVQALRTATAATMAVPGRCAAGGRGPAVTGPASVAAAAAGERRRPCSVLHPARGRSGDCAACGAAPSTSGGKSRAPDAPGRRSTVRAAGPDPSPEPMPAAAGRDHRGLCGRVSSWDPRRARAGRRPV